MVPILILACPLLNAHNVLLTHYSVLLTAHTGLARCVGGPLPNAFLDPHPTLDLRAEVHTSWDSPFTCLHVSIARIIHLRLRELTVKAAGVTITPIVEVLNLPAILRGALERRDEANPLQLPIGPENPVALLLARATQAAVAAPTA